MATYLDEIREDNQEESSKEKPSKEFLRQQASHREYINFVEKYGITQDFEIRPGIYRNWADECQYGDQFTARHAEQRMDCKNEPAYLMNFIWVLIRDAAMANDVDVSSVNIKVAEGDNKMYDGYNQLLKEGLTYLDRMESLGETFNEIGMARGTYPNVFVATDDMNGQLETYPIKWWDVIGCEWDARNIELAKFAYYKEIDVDDLDDYIKTPNKKVKDLVEMHKQLMKGMNMTKVKLKVFLSKHEFSVKKAAKKGKKKGKKKLETSEMDQGEIYYFDTSYLINAQGDGEDDRYIVSDDMMSQLGYDLDNTGDQHVEIEIGRQRSHLKKRLYQDKKAVRINNIDNDRMFIDPYSMMGWSIPILTRNEWAHALKRSEYNQKADKRAATGYVIYKRAAGTAGGGLTKKQLRKVADGESTMVELQQNEDFKVQLWPDNFANTTSTLNYFIDAARTMIAIPPSVSVDNNEKLTATEARIRNANEKSGISYIREIHGLTIESIVQKRIKKVMRVLSKKEEIMLQSSDRSMDSIRLFLFHREWNDPDMRKKWIKKWNEHVHPENYKKQKVEDGMLKGYGGLATGKKVDFPYEGEVLAFFVEKIDEIYKKKYGDVAFLNMTYTQDYTDNLDILIEADVTQENDMDFIKREELEKTIKLDLEVQQFLGTGDRDLNAIMDKLYRLSDIGTDQDLRFSPQEMARKRRIQQNAQRIQEEKQAAEVRQLNEPPVPGAEVEPPQEAPAEQTPVS